MALSPKARVLAFGGVVWIVIGLSFAAFPVERFSRPGPGGPMQFLDDADWFSTLWVIGGSVAVVCSFLRRTLPGRADQVGFLALAAPAFCWSAAYFWSWYFHLITEGGVGREANWRAGLIYGLLVGFILTIAQLLDPTDRAQPGPTIEEDHGVAANDLPVDPADRLADPGARGARATGE
jgi:hypothetical protein